MTFYRYSGLFLLLAILTCPIPAYSAESSPAVVRAQFCSGISDREPVDRLESISPEKGTLYYFTEVSLAAGDTLIHRWLHDGWTIAEVPLTVGADRWRTWSSKQIWHLGAGQITVQVVNGDGEVLLESSIPLTGNAEIPGTAQSSADR